MFLVRKGKRNIQLLSILISLNAKIMMASFIAALLWWSNGSFHNTDTIKLCWGRQK